MKKDTIKFSIICPLYNWEDFVENCIKSVLNQAYTNWELIINNDSTDKGPEICRSFMFDNRIKLINRNSFIV